MNKPSERDSFKTLSDLVSHSSTEILSSGITPDICQEILGRSLNKTFIMMNNLLGKDKVNLDVLFPAVINTVMECDDISEALAKLTAVGLISKKLMAESVIEIMQLSITAGVCIAIEKELR